MTAGVFLPAFSFTLLGHDAMERWVHRPGVAEFLSGVSGAVVGLIAGTTIALMLGGIKDLNGVVIFCVVLGDLVGRIPMPALVAIMIMVSIGTFSWASIGQLRTLPRSSNVVMLATVGFVVVTHNLAIGVLVGVLLSGIFFAGKIARMTEITSRLNADKGLRTYFIKGQIFFASVEDFNQAFDFREPLERVVIDLTHAHIWDISSVAALDRAIAKFRANGIEAKVVGMNHATETIIDRLSGQGASGH